MRLTGDQNKALSKLYEFTKTNNLFFTLAGSAGTGKTTIISHFTDSIRNGKNVIVSAPTHKACRVISNITNLKSKTIQQLLGLRPNLNLETFNAKTIQFSSFGQKHIGNHDIVIIDESSMLNIDLLNLIEKEATNYKTKIIFVGDELQLPPINESLSQVFIRYKHTTVILTEIVRQDINNPISGLIDMARDDVKNKTNNALTHIYSYPLKYNEHGGYISCPEKEFTTYVENAFRSTNIFDNTHWSKFGAFTNDCIKTWNKFIRAIVFPEATQLMIKDDLIISYSTLVDEFFTPIIINSEEYVVDSALPFVNSDRVNGYAVKLVNINTGEATKHLFIPDTNDPQTMLQMIELLESNINKATRFRTWKQFYDWRNQYQILNDLYSRDGKLLATKDIDYAYAISIHKMQGSTVNNIFINVQNIVYNKNGILYGDINLRNRLLYVALSRAKEKIIMMI
jgi:exodeoxyribonuclease-5